MLMCLASVFQGFFVHCGLSYPQVLKWQFPAATNLDFSICQTVWECMFRVSIQLRNLDACVKCLQWDLIIPPHLTNLKMVALAGYTWTNPQVDVTLFSRAFVIQTGSLYQIVMLRFVSTGIPKKTKRHFWPCEPTNCGTRCVLFVY
jgi:hypothetical protein